MNNIVPKKVIDVNTSKHWYSILNLIEKYPIENTRWQLADGNLAFEYFYELDEQPVTDPWGRQLRPWTRNGEGNALHWESATPSGQTSHPNGNYFRMTTIEGKAISLWLYPSPKHPLYKK